MDHLPTIITKDVQYGIAKVTTLLCFLYSYLLVLASHKFRNLYFKEAPILKDPEIGNRVGDLITQQAALCMLSVVITFSLHAFKEMERDMAIGVGILPWFIWTSHGLLNEECYKSVNSSPRTLYINLVFFGLVAYSSLTDQPYASLVNKVLAGFGLANGLLCYLMPTSLGKVYDIPNREDFLMLSRRSFGNCLTALSVFLGALSFGTSDLHAVGYCWVSYGFGLVLLLAEFKQHKGNMAKIAVWIIAAVFHGTIFLIDLKPKSTSNSGE